MSRNPGSRGAPSSAAKRPVLNEYFIEGDGILREVLQSEICRFLGAEATCRPGEHNNRPGYKIRALRPFTPEMLEDLRETSRDFRSERSTLQDRFDKGVSYEDSETRRRNEPQLSQHYQEPPRGGGYPVGSPYADGPAYPSMPAGYSNGSGYPSGSSYNPGGGQFPPGYGSSMAPSMGSTSSYAPPGSDPRYQPHYTTYVNQPSRGEYQPQDRSFYSEPAYAAEPPRSRGDPMPGSYAPYGGRGGPSDRPPMGNIQSGYADYEMGGTSAGHNYGAPPRGQAPSPYDTSRDHYGAQRPQPDPYSGSRRR